MSNIIRKHTVTNGHGQGKWKNKHTLAAYQTKRNKKNKISSESRKRNR